MLSYIVRRIIYMVPLMILVSFIAFIAVLIQPGDAFTQCDFSATFTHEDCNALRVHYGIYGPWYVQYWNWLKGILTHGDFGVSTQSGQTALQFLFGQGRLGMSLLVILLTSLFAWLVAIPLGIYSATHKYSVGDNSFSFLGFVGLSVPNFFFGLLLLYLLVIVFNVGQNYGLAVTNLCSKFPVNDPNALNYCYEPWSWGKLLNFLWHLWPAILIIGSANIAALMRYTRGNMLDVLGEPYIQTARAKGLRERVIIYKHAFRNAVNPLISILGFWIPHMFEGTLVAAIILNLPISENAYWRALTTQDQYVIMSGLLFFSIALLVGNLLADLMLAWADPKIRYD